MPHSGSRQRAADGKLLTTHLHVIVMAQGNKNKLKAKPPPNAKHKSNLKTNKKNTGFQKRKSVFQTLPNVCLGTIHLILFFRCTCSEENDW